LYPWFQVFQNLIFWMPVFFLLFASRFSVSDVLLLEAIYYAVVVVAEVPSGYFSDRIGRRLTLLGSSLCWFVAGIIFCITESFSGFAIGQVLLAAGMALRSGTDSSLLYESLKDIGAAADVAIHEARAQTWSLLALALAAIVGGAIAMFDLRLPYLMSALAAAVAVGMAYYFSEPGEKTGSQPGLLESARLIAQTRHNRVLMWLLAFSVSLTVLAHIPYEMLQPYIGFVFDSGARAVQVNTDDWRQTPLISGVTLAVTMGLGAMGSALSIRLCDRFGVGGVLWIAIAIIAGIILSMAVWVHWAVLAVISFRSLSSALATPVMNAVIHQQLPDSIRATYLSLHSLLGRLAFSLTLFTTAALVSHAPLTLILMRQMLGGFALLTIVLLPLLILGIRPLNRADHT
jgi:MFS family permease